MKGRKPKPLARQLAEGDTRKRGVRKLREQLAAEPKAARGLPDCPEHLTGRAREAWQIWKEELAAMKLDCRPDGMMLEGACVAWARAVLADLMLADGFLIEEPIMDATGQLVGHKIKTHPAVAVSNAAWKQLKAFCSEFGLSPVSRTRLTIEKQDNGEKDLMAMLSAPREPRTSKAVQ
jgi:P27 family predicted phage terminase small subunit